MPKKRTDDACHFFKKIDLHHRRRRKTSHCSVLHRKSCIARSLFQRPTPEMATWTPNRKYVGLYFCLRKYDRYYPNFNRKSKVFDYGDFEETVPRQLLLRPIPKISDRCNEYQKGVYTALLYTARYDSTLCRSLADSLFRPVRYYVRL